MPEYVAHNGDWYFVSKDEKKDIESGVKTKAQVCTATRAKKKD
jgi:hypothetical protein